MARTRLLDKGAETMLIYPDVEYINNRGERVKAPSDTPETLRVTVAYDRPHDAETPGQVQVKQYKILARQVPFGTWARIEFRGEEWDLAEPPTETQGTTKTTRHVEFVIRSRGALNAPRH